MRPFPLKVGRQAHPQSIFHARLSCSPWNIQRFPEILKKFKRGSKRWNNWNKLKQPENNWTTWNGHTFFVCCLFLLCFFLFVQHSPILFIILRPFPSCFNCFAQNKKLRTVRDINDSYKKQFGAHFSCPEKHECYYNVRSHSINFVNVCSSLPHVHILAVCLS